MISNLTTVVFFIQQKVTFYLKKGDNLHKLEKYLSEIDLSQRKFAKKIGTSPNNITKLIKGRGLPSLKMAYLIEKTTHGEVSMKDWLPKEDEEENKKIPPQVQSRRRKFKKEIMDILIKALSNFSKDEVEEFFEDCADILDSKRNE